MVPLKESEGSDKCVLSQQPPLQKDLLWYILTDFPDRILSTDLDVIPKQHQMDYICNANQVYLQVQQTSESSNSINFCKSTTDSYCWCFQTLKSKLVFASEPSGDLLSTKLQKVKFWSYYRLLHKYSSHRHWAAPTALLVPPLNAKDEKLSLFSIYWSELSTEFAKYKTLENVDFCKGNMETKLPC